MEAGLWLLLNVLVQVSSERVEQVDQKDGELQLGVESDVNQFEAANQEGADQALVIVRERNMVKEP